MSPGFHTPATDVYYRFSYLVIVRKNILMYFFKRSFLLLIVICVYYAILLCDQNNKKTTSVISINFVKNILSFRLWFLYFILSIFYMGAHWEKQWATCLLEKKMNFEKKWYFLILRIEAEACLLHCLVIFFYYCLNYCIYVCVIVYSMKTVVFVVIRFIMYYIYII